jgi:hypothetical protein
VKGKKCATCTIRPKLRVSRLLLSRTLPAQKQQELLEAAEALDPIGLFQQLEQVQHAVFRCAVSCSPVVSHIPAASIRVFAVEQCTAGVLQVEGMAPDPAAGLHTLNREQERRRRVLGWRRTRKDPFEGEWEQITRLSACQRWTKQWRHFPGVAASLSRALSALANPYARAAGCGRYEPPCWIPWRTNGRKKSFTDHRLAHPVSRRWSQDGLTAGETNEPWGKIIGDAMHIL